jgi:2-dehydro-3-deoxygalactonokinase
VAELGGLGPAWLISGVRCGDEAMRGEECELLGLLQHPAWAAQAGDAVVVLPGTHSKHVRLHDRAMVGLRTYLTGELYTAIGGHTVLARSLGPEAPLAAGSEAAAAFAEGVRTAADGALTNHLFRVRTGQLFQRWSPPALRALLSGLLIGSELHDLARREPACPLLLAAGHHQAPGYALAMATIGLAPRLHQASPAELARAVLAGHRLILTGSADGPAASALPDTRAVTSVPRGGENRSS